MYCTVLWRACVGGSSDAVAVVLVVNREEVKGAGAGLVMCRRGWMGVR